MAGPLWFFWFFWFSQRFSLVYAWTPLLCLFCDVFPSLCSIMSCTKILISLALEAQFSRAPPLIWCEWLGHGSSELSFLCVRLAPRPGCGFGLGYSILITIDKNTQYGNSIGQYNRQFNRQFNRQLNRQFN